MSGAVTCDDTINVFGSRDREPCFGSKTRLTVASGESSSADGTAHATAGPGVLFYEPEHRRAASEEEHDVVAHCCVLLVFWCA